MNKTDAREIIIKIFDYIDDYEEKTDFGTFKGHPGLYFFHAKREFNRKLNLYLKKDSYDRYDIYYICMMLVKFLLNKYDSHTKLFFHFHKNSFFPVRFKVENDKLYVVNITNCFDDVLGGELISINGIPIKKLVKELEQIICYSTKEHLIDIISLNLSQPGILKSLPSIDSNSKTFDYEISIDGKSKIIKFDEDKEYEPFQSKLPKNYSYEIKDNILIIHYNSCDDNEKMIKFVEQIKKESLNNSIKYFIVDIRYNRGGNGDITNTLLDFLKDKNIVTLVNERVFSSGAMAMVGLKKLGSYIIGTNIGTSINHFGEVPAQHNIDNLGLVVIRSNTYWYYDEILNLKPVSKDDFEDYFKDRKELLEPVLLNPDEYVYMSVKDIINNNDVQMNRAIDYINEIRQNEIK